MSDERKPMTDEELVAIKKRTDAITPGPWRVYYAHVPTDIARLLAEVERLREEKEILEETLDRLGIFVQENLNYCAADFIGEGIDEDAEFTCKTEYDPDNGCQKCYSNCWAEVFRKTAEEEIKTLKELEKENAE